LFHIAIERMECFLVNAGFVWFGCPARDNSFQIVPRTSNPFLNPDMLAKTEILTHTSFRRRRTNSSLLARGSIDDIQVESSHPSEKGWSDPIWCLQFDILANAVRAQYPGLTPNVGNADGLPCKQGWSTKLICISSIEQVPYTPNASIENQSMLWQAKATTDKRSVLLVGS
jgi:hypothetical protein